MTKKILIPIAQGYEEIELVSIVDVLRRAGVQVTLAYVKGDFLQEGAHCIKIMTEFSLEDLEYNDFDGIVLVGGMQGVQNMKKSQKILDVVLDFDAHKKLIGAICAAPLILDTLKLLHEDFCCYPSCETMMKNTQSKRLERAFKTNAHIVTATGPAFALEFALEIVAILLGEAKMKQLRKELCCPPPCVQLRELMKV